MPRMANQIWRDNQLRNVMTKSDGYMNTNFDILTAEEPEELYVNPTNPIELDYFENSLD